MCKWIHYFLFCTFFCINTAWSNAETAKILEPLPDNTTAGSWTFSGLVNNESGEKFGYFFSMQREGARFTTKAALIDQQTNHLIFFYEDKNKIEHQSTPYNWNVGYSFMRFNPINDSWVFGVKTAEKKGFNFKVDMLKQPNKDNEVIVLSPGINLQALQTSQLNGHIRIDDKEQFVTGNKDWFGKIVVSNEQKEFGELRTTFCRLNNDNGFYSANLKEKNAGKASVSGWFDPSGKKIKMSRFISMKLIDKDLCMLSVASPKLNLQLINTLKTDNLSHSIAGFSKNKQNTFCFVTQQSFLNNKG